MPCVLDRLADCAQPVLSGTSPG